MFEFKQLFRRADAVQRHLAAPLARSRLAYLRYRAELGAKLSTLRGIAEPSSMRFAISTSPRIAKSPCLKSQTPRIGGWLWILHVAAVLPQAP